MLKENILILAFNSKALNNSQQQYLFLMRSILHKGIKTNNLLNKN